MKQRLNRICFELSTLVKKLLKLSQIIIIINKLLKLDNKLVDYCYHSSRTRKECFVMFFYELYYVRTIVPKLIIDLNPILKFGAFLNLIREATINFVRFCPLLHIATI